MPARRCCRSSRYPSSPSPRSSRATVAGRPLRSRPIRGFVVRDGRPLTRVSGRRLQPTRDGVSGRPSGQREPRDGDRRAHSPGGRRAEPPRARSSHRGRGRGRHARDVRWPRTRPYGLRAHGADDRRARSRRDRREGPPRAHSLRRARGRVRDAAGAAGMLPRCPSPHARATARWRTAATNSRLVSPLTGKAAMADMYGQKERLDRGGRTPPQNVRRWWPQLRERGSAG